MHLFEVQQLTTLIAIYTLKHNKKHLRGSGPVSDTWVVESRNEIGVEWSGLGI